MTEFLLRQFNIIIQVIEDYQKDKLDLCRLIRVLEGVANVIDDNAWNNKILQVAWDLELINSELIDKKRYILPVEQNKINFSLRKTTELIEREINLYGGDAPIE